MPQEPPGPRRQLLFIVLVAAAAIVAIAVGAWKVFSIAPNSERAPGVTSQALSAARPVGRPAPDFTLPLFSAGTLSLHSLKGKPVVLNFRAS